MMIANTRWKERIREGCVDTLKNPVSYVKCPDCGFQWSDKKEAIAYFKHCPNCGTKMTVESANKEKENTVTLIARWKNGVEKRFEGLDKLNVIITKAEVKMWCEKNHYANPEFELI